MSNNIQIEWHYVDIDENMWYKNIEERNKKVESGEDNKSFCVDEGLLMKLNLKFEKPQKDEMNVIYINKIGDYNE